MSAPLAVQCIQLEKTFGTADATVRALRGVNLEIMAGEVMMLMGPSGSGKTTLISIMSGILHQTGGECIVLGQSLGKLSGPQLTAFRGEKIGFVFQAYNLIPMLSLEENVAMPLVILGESLSVGLARARDLLAAVGLEGRETALPTQISGGQAQRVAIARALSHRPKVIFCDEPTSALDATTGHQVMEVFQKLVSQEGATLVVVTHDARILSFADRIAHMEDGLITDLSLGERAAALEK
jgi:putative ABC transport system ATP-binding protein